MSSITDILLNPIRTQLKTVESNITPKILGFETQIQQVPKSQIIQVGTFRVTPSSKYPELPSNQFFGEPYNFQGSGIWDLPILEYRYNELESAQVKTYEMQKSELEKQLQTAYESANKTDLIAILKANPIIPIFAGVVIIGLFD